jgi:glutathione synthase/RimK-type ligase-like ATP-grasp enzyme
MADVRAALDRGGTRYVFVDQEAVTPLDLELRFDGALSASLQMGRKVLDLSGIGAAYLRPNNPPPAQGRNVAAVQAVRHAWAFNDAMISWAELTDAMIVNRPSAMASNNSKPFQGELNRSVGFSIPETIVTTEEKAVLEFWQQHGTVIYKSISGVRSIVTRLQEVHRNRLRNLAHCPTQFQRFVSGVDYRVHVVGEETFACEIESDADDYRYAGRHAAATIEAATLPDDVLGKCRALARLLNLIVTGIDLRRTKAGEWFCFEANPSPGFSFFEAATGQPISEAIASLLTRGCVSTPSSVDARLIKSE